MKDVLEDTENSDDYKTVYDTASDLIGESSTSFSNADLLADVDAVNVGDKLGSYSINSILRNYYSSGYKTRYTSFVESIAGNWKLSSIVDDYTDDYWKGPVKWPLLEETDVTDNQSEAIKDAFTDFISKRVEAEK